jgi:hypothetical protein
MVKFVRTVTRVRIPHRQIVASHGLLKVGDAVEVGFAVGALAGQLERYSETGS